MLKLSSVFIPSKEDYNKGGVWLTYIIPTGASPVRYVKETVCRPTERQLRKLKKELINANRNHV